MCYQDLKIIGIIILLQPIICYLKSPNVKLKGLRFYRGELKHCHFSLKMIRFLFVNCARMVF